MTTTGRALVESAVAFVAGSAVLLAPVLSDPGRTRYTAAFLPAVGDAVEGIKPISFLLLLALGLVLGLVARAPAVLLAAAAVALFPAWSIGDLMMGGDRHNLLPFEWMFYGFYGLVVLVGLGVGRGVRAGARRLRRRAV